MSPKLERINEIPNLELGEGPHWDSDTQSLYLVDIFGKSIHKYVPATGKHTKVNLAKPVSIVIPVKDKKDRFLVSLERELCIVTWDGASETVSNVEKIAELDEGTLNRINDGKCDPSGRLWVGTMGPETSRGHITPESGSLFSLNNGKIVTHETGIGISNGLAWNQQRDKFYYIDSFNGTVDQFDFDINEGTVANRTSIFTFNKHGIGEFPDGMTVDVDGNLWVAAYNGYKVVKIDPRKPETLLETIEIPAKKVTSVAWGGPNLDELYVTSASFTADGVVLPPPDHGATFKITGLGTKGFPGDKFVF